MTWGGAVLHAVNPSWTLQQFHCPSTAYLSVLHPLPLYDAPVTTMSSKLVRKQLSAFIAEQSKDGQKALAVKEKKAEKKRASALKKKVKELQKEAQAKKSAKLVLKKNTQYFQTTKAASEQNTELQLKLLAAATSGKK